jgi:recombination protein RecR
MTRFFIMSTLPKALENLIDALRQLPGVGSRSAERYAFSMYRNDPSKAHKLAEALSTVHSQVKTCPKTFALINSDQEVSPLYDDPTRDKQMIVVVAEAFDIDPLERTGLLKATYHVLGGLISPIDGVSPDGLSIRQLVKRVSEDKVKEIIIATNASVEGETTALYIQQQLGDHAVKITRLARGLSVGTDIEYADQITLGRALEGRQAL